MSEVPVKPKVYNIEFKVEVGSSVDTAWFSSPVVTWDDYKVLEAENLRLGRRCNVLEQALAQRQKLYDELKGRYYVEGSSAEPEDQR